MFKWLKKSFDKPRSLIGLDIGVATIKLVELEISEQGYQLSHVAFAQRLANSDLVNTLSELIKPLDLRCQDVAIALPDNQVISKMLQVDASFSPSEIETQVMFAIEEHIPHALTDIYFDFQIQNHLIDHPEHLDVLLIATRKKSCDGLMDAIAATGLSVQVMDVESYAIERAINRLPILKREQISAVLDLGVSKVTLCVMKNGRNIFIRSEPIELLQVNYESWLSETLRRLLQFFFSAYPYDEISCLFLTGGAALSIEVAHSLRQEMHIEIHSVNPFAEMPLSVNVDTEKLKQFAPCMLLSTGLALHDFLMG